MKKLVFSKKNILSAALIIFVLLLFTGLTPVHADDEDSEESDMVVITESVDIFTGLTESELQNNETKDDITITSTMKYNYQTDLYIYPVAGDSCVITANIADGMITTNPVSITVPKGILYEMYCDGTNVSNSDMSNITECGRYIFKTKSGNEMITLFNFQIIGEISSEASRFTLPNEFVFGTVLKDGEPFYPEKSYVSLSEEGEYNINYRCGITQVPYNLHIIVDRTAPVLNLENVKEGKARGPVDISDMEEDVILYMTFDGEQIGYSPVLTNSGTYNIIITDKAGNITDYNFRIMPYLDSKSWLAIATLVVAIAAIGVYLLIEKKKLKVR